MSRPIIAITAAKQTEAWHQLSKEEQDRLMAQVMAHRTEVTGVKSIVVSQSLDAQWDFFVVDEYPDLETMQKLNDLDAELNWRRYWTGMSFLSMKAAES